MKPSGVCCCATPLVLLLGLAQGQAAEKGAHRARPAKPKHWAFRPIHRPRVPEVHDRSWLGNPLDAFILARLEKNQLRPAADADPRTLLRRVYLDLIGLPPTPDEVKVFLDDHSAAALARVVEDLLARPEYGERWGRHWLDVARYAESNGYERDGAKPNAWRYRDYVINAFNKDKPYDRFLTEQLAGDEVAGSNAETQIATTFLRLGTWDDEPAEPRVDRYDQLDDVLGTTTAAFLGVTLRCARCHNHKFDPFTQKEYYRMLAVFEPLKRPQKGRNDLDRYVGTAQELAAYRARQGAKAKQLRPSEPPRAYIWYEDGPRAPITRVFQRGDPTKPVGEVKPGLPRVLIDKEPDPPTPRAQSTGRRLWLARWMTQQKNPLVARVMVNRVWQWHFGKGLVATPNDFGAMGEETSHPELLDWLAAELVARQWHVKNLHRLMVLSHTYRMAAVRNPVAARIDPQNRLLWRWPQRRLEAEAFRDSVLAVSGQLNRRMAGPSVYPTLPRAVLAGQSRPGQGWGKSSEIEAARRSIYIFVKRVLAVPELELLDAPDTSSSCEQRVVSTTAPQALTFLNGDFTHRQAGHLAARLEREAGMDAAAQVRRAFELALARLPRPQEVKASLGFLVAQEKLIAAQTSRMKMQPGDARRGALEAFCMVILNTNEFAYVN
jgi:hypothetical protein